MPILHLQLGGKALAPNGQQVNIPPAHALQQRGPVVQVSLSVAQSVAAQLMQQGHPVPPPVVGLALIDTGASITCVDEEAAQAVGAPVIDVMKMCSASHADHDANVYPVRFEVVGLPIALDAPRAMGAALKPQDLIMLIGRDLLQHCTLHYNGPGGEFTLSI